MAAYLSLDDPRMLALRARSSWHCVGLYMGLMHALSASRYRLSLSPHVITGLSYQLRISETDLQEFLDMLADLQIITLHDGELVAPDQVAEQERKRRAAEKRWGNDKGKAEMQPGGDAMQEPVFFVQDSNPAMQASTDAQQQQEPVVREHLHAVQPPQPALQSSAANPLPLSPPHPPYPENSLSPPPSLPPDGEKKFSPPNRETVVGFFVAAGCSTEKAEQEADVYISDRQRRQWEVQPGRHPAAWDWQADVQNWVARDRTRRRERKLAGDKDTGKNTNPSQPKRRLQDIHK